MEELVLNDGTYGYDFETKRVIVSEDRLRKLGYVKLADDEQVVKKVKLSEDEARFMESHKVRKEPKYYIKFPFNYSYEYLNVFKHSGKWGIESECQDFSAQTQFTQKEIDELQKDDRAKGLDFNALKVRVPDGELAD